MTAQTDDGLTHWRIDAKTGRPMELVFFYSEDSSDSDKKESSTKTTSAKESAPAAKSTSASSRVEIHFIPNELERRLRSLHQTAEKIPNSYDPLHPFRSPLVFLCEYAPFREYLKSYFPGGETWLPVAQKLLERGMVDPFDQWCLEQNLYHSEEKGREFQIPFPPDLESSFSQLNGFHVYILWALIKCDLYFPRASWPWSLCNQWSFGMLNQPRYWRQEYQRIVESQDTGPLCYLLLSSSYVEDHPAVAAFLSKKGLEKLSKNAFLKDCEHFLDKDYWSGQAIRHLAEVFRRLSDEDLALLARQMNPRQAKLLAECKRILRGDPKKPLDTALPELLAALYDAWLNDLLQSALADLRNRIAGPDDAL
jgi:hypothetical protein